MRGRLGRAFVVVSERGDGRVRVSKLISVGSGVEGPPQLSDAWSWGDWNRVVVAESVDS